MSRIAVVTGGRAYHPTPAEFEMFEKALLDHAIDRVDVGDATGVDTEVWSRTHHRMAGEKHRANWSTEGPAAGSIRNGRMLEQPGVVVCIAFRGGTGTAGTADCVSQAKALGISVVEIDERQRSLF